MVQAPGRARGRCTPLTLPHTSLPGDLTEGTTARVSALGLTSGIPQNPTHCSISPPSLVNPKAPEGKEVGGSHQVGTFAVKDVNGDHFFGALGEDVDGLLEQGCVAPIEGYEA